MALVTLALATAIASGACLPGTLRPTPTPAPTPSPSPTPQPTPSPTPGPPTPTPAPTFALYTVARGDSLTSKERQIDTTAPNIAYSNLEAYTSLAPEYPDYDPNRLQAGWVLRILPGQVHEAPLDEGEPPDETPVPTLDDEAVESPDAGG